MRAANTISPTAIAFQIPGFLWTCERLHDKAARAENNGGGIKIGMSLKISVLLEH